MKKRLEDGPKSKTAFEKDRSGLLLINLNDIDTMLGRNVTFLHNVPIERKAYDGIDSFAQLFLKAGTRPSARKHHEDDDFLFMAWLFMLNRPPPSFAPAAPEYRQHEH